MQSIQYIKDKNAVLVPVNQWDKLQNEIRRLKKRLKKAEILTEIKESISDLRKDLRDETYDARNEISADEFLAQLNYEQ